MHGVNRVGPGRVVVSPSRPLRNERLPFVASRGRDGPSPRRHGALRPLPIRVPAHSSDRGVCIAGTRHWMFICCLYIGYPIYTRVTRLSSPTPAGYRERGQTRGERGHGPQGARPHPQGDVRPAGPAHPGAPNPLPSAHCLPTEPHPQAPPPPPPPPPPPFPLRPFAIRAGSAYSAAPASCRGGRRGRRGRRAKMRSQPSGSCKYVCLLPDAAGGCPGERGPR